MEIGIFNLHFLFPRQKQLANVHDSLFFNDGKRVPFSSLMKRTSLGKQSFYNKNNSILNSK
jgi:hypothetical protein